MISVPEALARLLALKTPVETETLPIELTLGRWLAEPVYARRTQPSADLSAMDGYAIRYADMPGPWRVVGESAAGRPAINGCGDGEAIRIFTGANLPRGTDTIVIQEDVVRAGNRLTLTGDGPAAPGVHVRASGSDFVEGAPIFRTGDMMTAARVGLAWLGGVKHVPVHRPIRIALFSTGDELANGTLPDSNRPMLRALLASLPCEVSDLGVVADAMAPIMDAIRDAAGCDILVTTGGASVGDHDLVRPAMVAAGAKIDFWKVAMRPGKPIMAGTMDDVVVLGLPGNPVSAFVTATLFLKPLIAYLSGARDPGPHQQRATLAAPMPMVGAREDYVRGHWQDGHVMPIGGDSGMLVPLAQADVLIIRAAGAAPAQAGDVVHVIPIT